MDRKYVLIGGCGVVDVGGRKIKKPDGSKRRRAFYSLPKLYVTAR
jgi:hypothetical protein